MRAISIRQPFAAYIALGEKAVENRGHAANWRGEVAIHAGRTRAEQIFVTADDPITRYIDVLGAVLAVAVLVDCHPATQHTTGFTCCRPWGMQVYNERPAHHLVLADIRPLDRPVPCRGQLRVGWELPDDVERQVREQLAGVAQ